MTPSPAPPHDAAALRPGACIEEYEVQSVLGGGGFGITYLARDAHLELPVAVKEYFPGELLTRAPDGSVMPRTGDAQAQQRFQAGLQRFIEEARALASFRHPHIVRVLRYFTARGTAYIVMEYESGQPLRRWLPQQRRLTGESLLALIAPLLDGLEAVHAAGFLHRDIKPDNIYVRTDGSPVLLDFGAARRLSAEGEMTTLVSPGFAPFEQYHAQGVQGAWTDIYAIGAVMYWMATGRKPLEAAGRIQTDTMPSAAALADPALFSASLLQAIDWALQPHEQQRPQSVAQLRAALLGGPTRPSGAPVDSASSRPALASHRRRTLLGTILFLDLAGYSARSVDDQAALKKRLNELIAAALAPVAEDSRVAIDTGDGAALCFLDDPEEALNAALLLRDLLTQRYGAALPVRIGLHVGPVRLVSDINNRINVIGDGINMAQRVMDFAQPGQVLASRAYHDVVSRISDDAAPLFRYLGQRQDKHGRLHELHVVQRAPRWAVRERDADFAPTQPSPEAWITEACITEGAAHEMAESLARTIGPMARVLVTKARRRAPTREALRSALAPLIPDTAAREAFLLSTEATAPSARPRIRARAPGAATRPPVPSTSGAAAEQPHSDQALAAIEQALGRHIGPMSRVLLRQALASRGQPADIAAALADHIDHPRHREAFRALALRALTGS